MRFGLLLFFLLSILILVVYVILFNRSDDVINNSEIEVNTALSGSQEEKYEKALYPRAFDFPRDHFAHDNFRTEWWYFTGNLINSQGIRFGYQFTIFRTAMNPVKINRKSNWNSHQIYMGHFAITDIESGSFYSSDQITRNGNGLGGSDQNSGRIWCEDWQIEIDSINGNEKWTITASDKDKSISLELIPVKERVYHGDSGLSMKSKELGNASYYYSYTRMLTQGKLKIAKNEYKVSGESWMDREWSTSALSKDQTGWDWFSIQFRDTTELMYFRLRKSDGSTDFEKGSFISSQGEVTKINEGEVSLITTGNWVSPLGGTYPSGWKMEIPKLKIELLAKPLLKSQELNVALRYWEGAVEVESKINGISTFGHGYVELTGYTK